MSQEQRTGHAEEPTANLRQRAEDAWRLRAMDLEQHTPPAQVHRLVHELQVHQIELEMQNEELQQAQQELEAARDKYFDLYDLAPVGYLTLSDKGLIQGANLTLAALLGVERTNLVKQPLTRFIFPEDQDLFYQQRRRLEQTGVQQAYDLRMLRRDAAPFWANIEIVVKPDAAAESLSYWVTVTDISERKQAEALRESERFLRTTVDALPAHIAVLDETGSIIAVNRVWREFAQANGLVCAAGCEGTNYLAICDAVHGADSPQAAAMAAGIRAVMYGAQAEFSFEYLSTPPTEKRWFAARVTRFPGEGPVRTVVAHENISERKRQEEALRASEARWQFALEGAGDGIWDWDTLTDQVFFSRQWKAMFGYADDEIGHTLDEWDSRIHPDDKPQCYADLARHFAGETPIYQNEHRVLCKDGTYQWILDRGKVIEWTEDGKPRRVIGTHTDISARKRAEASLLQTQKLESLGLMAGGIAHDFNNLLVALLGQSSLALTTLPPENAARSHIEAAIVAAERASDLTRQLLAYSGRGQFMMHPIQLNTLIKDNSHMLEVAMPKQVRLQVELAEGLPSIQADAGQMQQVVMNLIINAADAVGDRSGTVMVSTDTWELMVEDAGAWIHGSDPLEPGTFVRLEVSDDGCGMDAPTMAKIFDPFFSTKAEGRGLGLAALLGIVGGHQGGLRVESRPGAGTKFQLIFPVAKVEEATTPAIDTLAPALIRPVGVGKGILVIDDEDVVRMVLTDVLEAWGYHVLCAADGASGMALYREHATSIGLVLLDLSMPGQSSPETFRQLRAFDPQVRIALSSGYDASDVAARFAGLSFSGFLQKPYQLQVLIDAVERYLAAN